MGRIYPESESAGPICDMAFCRWGDKQRGTQKKDSRPADIIPFPVRFPGRLPPFLRVLFTILLHLFAGRRPAGPFVVPGSRCRSNQTSFRPLSFRFT